MRYIAATRSKVDRTYRVLPFTVLQTLIRLGGLSNGQLPLTSLVLFLNLDASFLVKFSHESSDVATAIIAK